MNEPSNFCNGACDSAKNISQKKASVFTPNDPPYQINNQNTREVLNTKTIDMDAVQYGGVPHYNAHNLYGNK